MIDQNTHMKKIIFIIAMTVAVSFANAQTRSGQSSKNTVQSAPVNKKAKRTIKSKRSLAKADTLNNRKIYKSKATGQAATPTGQEATGTNGSHATNPKNAARKNE
jgi:hypothetical protein